MTSHAGQPMHVDLSTQGGQSNEEALARAITGKHILLPNKLYYFMAFQNSLF